MSEYQTIVADPPWPYSGHLGSSKAHRPNRGPLVSVNSELRYGKMAIKEICAMPVPSAENAHLYLWTTNRFVVEAHEIARAWGFRPVTLLTWGKIKPDGSPSMKMGHYFRGATEHIVFAVKGKLEATGKTEPTLFLSPRLPHSQKPEWFYYLVERQSPGPYLELFARRKRLGWHAWGNEVFNDVRILLSTLNITQAEDDCKITTEATTVQFLP